MGNMFRKPSTLPCKDFVKNCIRQGFSITSPPVYLDTHVHTIDLDVDNNMFYVERTYDGELLHKYACRIEYLESDDVRIIYHEGDVYDVKDIHATSNGNLYVMTKEGNYVVPKERIYHEHFPKFIESGYHKYDLLASLFHDTTYAPVAKIERNV